MRGMGGVHVKNFFKNFPKSEKKPGSNNFSTVETLISF